MPLKWVREYDSIDDAEKARLEDIIHSSVKYGLTFIPGAGPVLSEVFGFMFTSPMEARRTTFFRDLESDVKKLLDEDRLTIEDLKENEEFMNVVVNAIPMALRAFEDEKRRALRNAILNTALRANPDETKTQIFLRKIDELTVMHLQVLLFFSNPKKHLQKSGIQPAAYMTSSLSSALYSAFPDFKKHDSLVEIIWQDLKISGFHRSGDLKTMMSADGAYQPQLSTLGNEFISFITYDDKL